MHISVVVLTLLLMVHRAGTERHCIPCYNCTPVTKPHSLQEDFFRILPFGDSITQGAVHGSAYRRTLWHLLRDNGHDCNFVGTRNRSIHNKITLNCDFDVQHEGHSGIRTAHMIKFGFVQAAMRTQRPDIVLFHLGTNDIILGENPGKTAQNVRQLLRLIYAANPSVTIIITRLVPNKGTEGMDRRTKQLNKVVVNTTMNANAELPKRLDCEGDPTETCEREVRMARQLATKYTVLLADVSCELVDRDFYKDMIHPTEGGNEKIARGFYYYLAQLLPPPRPRRRAATR